MPKDRTYWLDSDDSRTVARGLTWRAIVYPIVALIIVGGLVAGVWAIKVATSGVRGTGNVIQRNNDADNRINTQAYFEDLNGDITSYTVRLQGAIRDLKAHPGDQFYETNYTGLWNTCVSAVAAYNAASAKTLFHDWKTADLPQTIDQATACPTDQ